MIIQNENIISFTKVKLPYGWLSNMSPHKVIYKLDGWYNSKEEEFATAESLFQALRFDDISIVSQLRRETNPMKAKRIAKANTDKMVIQQLRDQDLKNMRSVIISKLKNNKDLVKMLLDTKESTIIEDVTARLGGSSMFWGAAFIQGMWIGENMLGRIWMSIRENLQNGNKKV
jgi:ribA/ribD-fused uncharacterized protein